MDWIELFKVIATILASVITTFGAGWITLKKFYLERQDKKDDVLLQKKIDDSIEKAKKEMREEMKMSVHQGIVDCGVIRDKAIRQIRDEFMKKLEEGLKATGDEGKEMFEINSRQIQENSRQLSENSKQIEALVSIVKVQAERNDAKFAALTDTLASLNKMALISAESQCNSNYDRLLFVTNKVLKSGRLTISDKTNLKQLYTSWKDLGGKDAKMDTLYEECIKITPIPDE